VLGALASGRTVLHDPLVSRDTSLMAAALAALGSPVVQDAASWSVLGAPVGTPVAAAHVDVGNAGTVARFVPGVAALRSGTVSIDGDPRVRERPVAPLLDALRALGAAITGDAFPILVRGLDRLRGGTVEVDASTSSQLVSGLLLVGPLCESGVVLRHAGPPLPSRPHVDMTVAMMRSFGASVSVSGDEWTVRPGSYTARVVDVEPDLSGAAPFLAAAAVTGGVVRVPGWPLATNQPAAALPGLLAAMGCSFSLGADGLVLRGAGTLAGIDADLRDCPEAAPVLAAVACVASGPSVLRGIAHLRLQETDRLAALATELTALGASVSETADGLSIVPGALRGGSFATYDDHRLAMAAAVLGLVVPGVVVENVETVGKTMPDFVDRWRAMLP